MATSLENYITTSREELRVQMIDYLKKYLQLNIDLEKTRFLAYIIDTLSVLTANNLFFCSMSTSETLLKTSQTPNSVIPLASYIGYSASRAIPSFTELSLDFDIEYMPSDFSIIFSKDMNFYAGTIPFNILGEIVITRLNNSITVTLSTGTTESGSVNLPYVLENNRIFIMFPVIQQKTSVYNYIIDNNIQPFEFFKITEILPASEQIVSVSVYVNNIKYEEYSEVYEMSSTVSGFVSTMYNNQLTIQFGNGTFGLQPPAGGNVMVYVTTTMGKNGEVISNTIKKGDPVRYTQTDINGDIITQVLSYNVNNPNSCYGGQNYESISSIKKNAIINLKASNNLVSLDDYQNIQSINRNYPFKDTYGVLKESDLKRNEVVLYHKLMMTNKIVPTRTEHLIGETINNIKPYVSRTILGEEYYCPFNILLDENENKCDYYYIPMNYKTGLKTRLPIKPEYPVFLSDAEIVFNAEDEEYNIKINYFCQESYEITSEHTVNLRLKGFTYDYQVTLEPIITDSTSGYYSTNIDMNFAPPDEIFLTVTSKYQNTVINIYDSQFYFKKNMYKLCYSNISIENVDPLSYTIYDVPLIKKSWYDNLTIEEKFTFDQILYSFVDTDLTISNRMTNIFINMKFSNTTGYLKNIFYNEAFTVVSKSVIDYSQLTSDDKFAGNKILIIGPVTNPSDLFYDHDQEVAMMVNTSPEEWIFDELPTSSFLLNEDTDQKLFFNGKIWYSPQIELPIKIKAIVYTVDGSLDVVESIKKSLLTWKDRGHDVSIYRSNIISVIEGSNSKIMHCELITPKIDILFNYDIDNFNMDQFFSYVPEYIYFTEDTIEIEVRLYNKTY